MRCNSLVILGSCALVFLACSCVLGCSNATASTSAEAFTIISDIVAEHHPERDEAVRYEQLATLKHAERVPESQREAVSEPIYNEVDTYSQTDYSEPYIASESFYYPTSGLTREGGVNYYNGQRETWYSSNVLHHYRTNEWTLDDEGFYRTDEGYYVVASDTYEQGAVIETSKGLAQVLDSGSGDATDFYVSW